MTTFILICLFIIFSVIVYLNNRGNSYLEYLKLKPVLPIQIATEDECLMMANNYNVIPNQLNTLENLPYDKKTQWLLSNCDSVLSNMFILEGKFKLSGTEIFQKYSGQSVFITIGKDGKSLDNVPPATFFYDSKTKDISFSSLNDTTKKYYGKIIDSNSFYIENNIGSTLYSRIL